MLDKLSITLELNNLAGALRYPRKNEGCVFYQGSIEEQVSIIAQKIVPYGKVALFYTKSTFEKIGRKVSACLKKQSIKIVNVLLPKKIKSVASCLEVFNLPEDVRMVFAFDKELFDVAKYFCAINGLQCGLVIKNPNFFNSLSNKILANVGTSPEYVDAFTIKHVILADELFDSNDSYNGYLYARLVSGLSFIVDYRISSTLKRKPINKRAFNLIKSGVTGGLSVMKYSLSERKTALIYFNLILEIANVLSLGEIINGGAMCYSERLFNALNGIDDGIDDGNINHLENGYGYILLKLCKKILGVYEIVLSSDNLTVYETCDYTSRVEFLTSLTGGEELSYLKNFKQQIDLISCSQKEIDKIKAQLYGQVKSFYLYLKASINTYHAIGGKDFIGAKTPCDKRAKKAENSAPNPLNSPLAIKYAGDEIGALNGMTLARELGVTDNPAFCD
ncbi:MAG: hypothetical protein IJZ73_02215 [Clostridia bacterium]|nr:hypothetical protein [Clostridia bacterium]